MMTRLQHCQGRALAAEGQAGCGLPVQQSESLSIRAAGDGPRPPMLRRVVTRIRGWKFPVGRKTTRISMPQPTPQTSMAQKGHGSPLARTMQVVTDYRYRLHVPFGKQLKQPTAAVLTAPIRAAALRC